MPKKQLYLTLVRSQLIYYSQLWRPFLIKDIMILERVQRRATKFILNNYTSPYKSRLTRLNSFPVMYQYELNDLLFFIKSYKAPSAHFDIRCQFVPNLNHPPLDHLLQANWYIKHLLQIPIVIFIFVDYQDYGMLYPKLTNLPPTTIKILLTWSHFLDNFDTNSVCTFHLCCPCNNCTSLTQPTPYSPVITYFLVIS